MGEILKKYANVLDADGDEPNLHNEKAPELAAVPSREFVPYAESGGKKKPGGFYSDKPEGGELRGYSSFGQQQGRKEMEGETYRQTKAADVDAERAFERMTYHDDGSGGGSADERKRKKSPYAHA